MATTTRVALLGTGGYGRIHLQRLARLATEGRTELVAVADPAGPSEHVPAGTPAFTDLDALLAAHQPDVVIVSTPIHTHVPLAAQAMEAGADVYLEKPPAAGLGPFAELVAVQERTGRLCQVGFQSLGSHGLARIASLVAEGTIGEVVRYEARGLWVRTRSYYQRSPWAGRRRDGDVVVADGVTTNPLSHSIATALRIAGVDTVDRVDAITTELYRAHAIECDDTSFVRVDPRSREDGSPVPPLVAGLTLCAPDHHDALVDVVGTAGRLSFHYTADVLDVLPDGAASTTEQVGRTDLFENLLDHREDPSVELLSPLVQTSAFTAVLQATLDAPAPTVLAEPEVTWVGDGPEAHPVLADVDHWIGAAVTGGRGYAAAGAPWARTDAVTHHRIGRTG